jgi:hypothetical protein
MQRIFGAPFAIDRDSTGARRRKWGIDAGGKTLKMWQRNTLEKTDLSKKNSTETANHLPVGSGSRDKD